MTKPKLKQENIPESLGPIYSIENVEPYTRLHGPKVQLNIINCGKGVEIHSLGEPKVSGTIGEDIICYVYPSGNSKQSQAQRMRLLQNGKLVKETHLVTAGRHARRHQKEEQKDDTCCKPSCTLL